MLAEFQVNVCNACLAFSQHKQRLFLVPKLFFLTGSLFLYDERQCETLIDLNSMGLCFDRDCCYKIPLINISRQYYYRSTSSVHFL